MNESRPIDSVMVSLADNGESRTGGICVGDGIPAANSKRQRCAPSCVCVCFVSVMAHARRFVLANVFVCLVSLVSAAALSYAPKNTTCPASLIRYGDNGLSPLESQYISQRRTKAAQNLQSWLEHVNLENFNVSAFFANQSNVPTLAIAFSGGGYRAMLNGAGVFQGISCSFLVLQF